MKNLWILAENSNVKQFFFLSLNLLVEKELGDDFALSNLHFSSSFRTVSIFTTYDTVAYIVWYISSL